MSPTIIFSGSDPSTETLSDAERTLQYLHALPCLQHIEIGLPIKHSPNAGDRAQWREKRYYNLECLTNMVTLKSVIINMSLNGAIRRKLYKSCLKREEEGCLRCSDHIIKAALDDAYGLRSWLQEGFRQKGMDVDVRCKCHDVNPYREAP